MSWVNLSRGREDMQTCCGPSSCPSQRITSGGFVVGVYGVLFC